jgi:short-subunit dehydrogenase
MTQRSIFVTGASSGLGMGLALHYAKQGHQVFAAARRVERLREMARDLADKGELQPVELDVQDTDALVAAIHKAEKESGGALDTVIANAGIGHETNARHLEWEWVKRLFDVNTTAAAVTLAAAAPAMVKAGKGRLVGISSLAAFRALPGNCAYSGSKAGLATFIEGLRIDLRGSGVSATCIYPGFVKTELTAKNKFKMPFIMELDDAVKVMARGIDKRAANVSFPAPLSLGTKAFAALPRPIYEALAHRAGKRVNR